MAAMTFGPKKVILVCGVNKIVRDIARGRGKGRGWAAPMNTKRIA